MSTKVIHAMTGLHTAVVAVLALIGAGVVRADAVAELGRRHRRNAEATAECLALATLATCDDLGPDEVDDFTAAARDMPDDLLALVHSLEPPGRAMTPEQLDGLACAVCGRPFGTEPAVPNGRTDLGQLFEHEGCHTVASVVLAAHAEHDRRTARADRAAHADALCRRYLTGSLTTLQHNMFHTMEGINTNG